MQELMIYILITVFIFFIGFFLYPLLQKKGLISKQSLSETKQWLDMIDILANNFIKDELVKSKTKLINEIAKEVVQYVENVATTADNDIKKQLAVDAVIKVLNKMNIFPTNDEIILIDFAIEQAVKLLHK